MPTPKELKGELEGKFIDAVRSPWHKKRYKVLGYDSETDLYTCAATKVDGPLEHIKLKAENIEVYVEVIPMESSDEEDETESSEDEDEDEDDEELVEKVRKMKQKELRAECTKHELWSSELVQANATVPEMKEALMKKFGLEGCTLSDKQQKIEESKNATAIFFQLAGVVAIISNIRGFDPKNTAHAQSFMEQYREQNGKGTTRSRK